MTTSSATSDDKIGIMTTFDFQRIFYLDNAIVGPALTEVVSCP